MTPAERHLSPTERRVVARLAQGDTYQQIGDRLGISPETAATHRRNAVLRLHARSVPHLVALAIAYRLIPANVAMPKEVVPSGPQTDT